MKTTSDINTLINQIPELDSLSKVTGPEWKVAEEIVLQILRGGQEAIDQVVAMLVPPGETSDCRPRYVLHAVALYVCRPEGAEWRPLFERAIAAHLGGDLPKLVQGFLIQQLQTAGTVASSKPLGALLLDSDLCDEAARALLAIGDGAIEQCRKALPEANEACLLPIVQAIGVLRDGKSVDELRARLAPAGPGLRLAIVEALAQIGSLSAVDNVLAFAAGAKGFERVRAIEACFVLAQRLRELGHEQAARKICERLYQTCSDPAEAHVRESAKRAMTGR